MNRLRVKDPSCLDEGYGRVMFMEIRDIELAWSLRGLTSAIRRLND